MGKELLFSKELEVSDDIPYSSSLSKYNFFHWCCPYPGNYKSSDIWLNFHQNNCFILTSYSEKQTILEKRLWKLGYYRCPLRITLYHCKLSILEICINHIILNHHLLLSLVLGIFPIIQVQNLHQINLIACNSN